MKKNILFMFFGLLIGVIACSTVYAINAGEITYKSTTVDAAIDNLYLRTDVSNIFTSSNFYRDYYAGSRTANKTINLDLEAGKYLVMLNYGIAWGSSSIWNVVSTNSRQIVGVGNNCTLVKSDYIDKSATTQLGNLYYTQTFYTSIYNCIFDEATTVSYVTDTTSYSDSPIVAELTATKLD